MPARPRRTRAAAARTPAPRRAAAEDGETRRRLLDVAAELFAEHGLDGVTVRQLCQAAGANVAAVNYHFGDKLGLYSEVIDQAIAAMCSREQAADLPAGPPEEQLAWIVHRQLQHVLTRDESSWIHRLIVREMREPTPALDRVVREALRPRLDRLARVVAELMGSPADDPRVGAVVASVQGLPVLLSHRNVVKRLIPSRRLTPEAIQDLADRTTRFVLGGIRALQAEGPAPRR